MVGMPMRVISLMGPRSLTCQEVSLPEPRALETPKPPPPPTRVVSLGRIKPGRALNMAIDLQTVSTWLMRDDSMEDQVAVASNALPPVANRLNHQDLHRGQIGALFCTRRPSPHRASSTKIQMSG